MLWGSVGVTDSVCFFVVFFFFSFFFLLLLFLDKESKSAPLLTISLFDLQM